MNFQKVCINDKTFLTATLPVVKAGELSYMDLKYLSQSKCKIFQRATKISENMQNIEDADALGYYCHFVYFGCIFHYNILPRNIWIG